MRSLQRDLVIVALVVAPIAGDALAGTVGSGNALGASGPRAAAPSAVVRARDVDDLVLVRSAAPLAERFGVRLVARRGSEQLVRADRDARRALEAAGLICAPLRAPAANPAVARAGGLRAPVAADPLIQSLVDQVSWEDLAAVIGWLEDFETRYALAPPSLAAALGLADVFEGLGLSVVLQPIPGYAEHYNVVARQGLGAPSAGIFVIGAHYDSISETPMVLAPGADDNASGVAAVVTAATLLAPLTCDYEIHYVAFGGEELGLDGSDHYATFAAQEGWPIVGMLNFDMIGWWEPGVDFDLEIETNRNSDWLAEIVTAAAELYTAMPYELHVNDLAWWGDHWSFWQQGFAAINHEESYDWYDADFNPRYHSTGDLLVHLSPEFTVGNVQIAVAALATLVGPHATVAVEEPLVRSRPVVRAHPNPFNGQVSFRWEGFPAGDALLEIFDLRGRRVRSLPVSPDGGVGEVVWRAENARGETLPAGIYFGRLRGGGQTALVRVVYAK